MYGRSPWNNNCPEQFAKTIKTEDIPKVLLTSGISSDIICPIYGFIILSFTQSMA